MSLDLFVDTSRKGISIALAGNDSSLYEEIINPEAKGETLSKALDDILAKAGAKLDDILRVMVTVGPGSFSGLRTGVAFCQGICFSGARKLYGVSTLHALGCFAKEADNSKVAVLIRARNGYWYLRLNDSEKFIETEDALKELRQAGIREIVMDDAAMKDEAVQKFASENSIACTLDVGKPLTAWAALFDSVAPSLIQEANYIQPSYFEKLQK